MREKIPDPVPDGDAVVGEPEPEPFYRRSWIRRTILFMGLFVMLVLLGLLFSPRFWRF